MTPCSSGALVTATVIADEVTVATLTVKTVTVTFYIVIVSAVDAILKLLNYQLMHRCYCCC